MRLIHLFKRLFHFFQPGEEKEAAGSEWIKVVTSHRGPCAHDRCGGKTSEVVRKSLGLLFGLQGKILGAIFKLDFPIFFPTIVVGDLNAKYFTRNCRQANPNGRRLLDFSIRKGLTVEVPHGHTYFPYNGTSLQISSTFL